MKSTWQLKLLSSGCHATWNLLLPPTVCPALQRALPIDLHWPNYKGLFFNKYFLSISRCSLLFFFTSFSLSLHVLYEAMIHLPPLHFLYFSNRPAFLKPRRFPVYSRLPVQRPALNGWKRPNMQGGQKHQAEPPKAPGDGRTGRTVRLGPAFLTLVWLNF